MTPEALTQARVQEAIRIVGEQGDLNHYGAEVALAMARLIEQSWEPVDPLLLEARHISADAWGTQYRAALIVSGTYDDEMEVTVALAALKRGIEIGRQSVVEEGQ